MPPLSPSSGKVLLDCMWAYREQYIRKSPTLKSDPMVFGGIVHESIQKYVDHLIHTKQSKAQLDIPAVWDSFVADRPKGISDRFYEESRRLLLRFAETFTLQLDHVWKAEVRLALDKDGQPIDFFSPHGFLRGVADLILVFDGWLAEVADWKTSRWPITEEKLKDDLQAGTYAAMMFKINPAITSVRVKFVYPRANQSVQVDFSKDDGDAIWAKWQETSARLDKALLTPDDKRVWAPTPGKHCEMCNVAARCPLGMVQVGASSGVAVSEAGAEHIAKRLLVLETVEKMLKAGLRSWVDHNGMLIVEDQEMFDFTPQGLDVKTIKALCERHFIDPMSVLRVDTDALRKAADKDSSFEAAVKASRTSNRDVFSHEPIGTS